MKTVQRTTKKKDLQSAIETVTGEDRAAVIANVGHDHEIVKSDPDRAIENGEGLCVWFCTGVILIIYCVYDTVTTCNAFRYD